MAAGLRDRARTLLELLRDRPPVLASLHLTDDRAFGAYLRRQEAAARTLGLEFRSVALPAGTAAAGLDERIRALDADPAVDAVLLEHPLPPALDAIGALAALRPTKDVDGAGPESLGRLVAGHPVHLPAVVQGALEILRHYGIPVARRRVAVVGRSETVGLPMALALVARSEGGNATVTIAHSRTADLVRTLAGSEIVIGCAGRPGLLDRATVPRGAVVVDVGLTMGPDPDRPGALRPLGDADATALEGWASAVTPVPGGVGPACVAALMLGVARAAEMGRRAGP